METITPANVITKADGTPFDNTGQVLAMPTQERDFANIYLVQSGSDVVRYFFKNGLTNSDLTVWETEASSVGFSSYQAIFTQTGTSAPTVTVLNAAADNYLGAITWAYIGPGTYDGTKTGAFTADKTFCPQSQTQCYNSTDDAMFVLSVARTGANVVRIFTGDDAVAPANGKLTNKFIEIRVFA